MIDPIAQQVGKALAEPLGHAGSWDEDSTAISFFLMLNPPEAAELSQVLPSGSRLFQLQGRAIPLFHRAHL